MRLFIAEKPSVANDIAKALGGSIQKKNGYIEADEDLVTWCYGHLLKTVEPESYRVMVICGVWGTGEGGVSC